VQGNEPLGNGNEPVSMNQLCYGDNLDILRRYL
jgi:hypothetical protein